MRVLRLSPCVVALLCCLVMTVSPALCEDMGSAFTYQGKLTDSAGQPVPDGSRVVQFKLFDDATPGVPDNQVGATLSKTVITTGGLFTTDLDFGVSAFNTGEARWLEIATGGSTLAPRIRVTPTPYSVFSAAPWATVTGGIGYSGGNVAIGGTNPVSKLDVTGTVKMTGFQLGASATAGNVLTANASGVGTWQPIPATPPTGAAGGDLTGTYPNPTIAANAVTNTKLASDSASLGKVSGGAMGVSGSNVGVGCSTPAFMFQVHGSNMTVDQAQPNSNIGGSTMGAGGYWQSFTAGVTSKLVAVQANFMTGGGSSFTVYSGEGTGGAVLCTQELPGSYNGDHFIVLNNPVPITAGSKYTFLIWSSDATSILLWKTDVYPGGVCSAGGDMLFRTYVCSSPALPLLVADYMTQTVGIGTGTPTARLDVNGGVKMTGFRLGTSATSGQVLTADASGNGTWQPPASSLPPSGTAGGDLTGTYPNPAIATGAVTSAKIADGTIAAVDLGASSVDTNKILDGAVTSAKILDGTIAAVDLGANSVDTNKILDGTIAAADLGSTSVTTAKLADGAVTSAKILDGTIAAADLGASCVDTTKLADAAVTQAKIASNLSVDQVDGKHATDLASSSQFGVIGVIPVTSTTIFLTVSGSGGSGYLATAGWHGDTVSLFVSAGVLEWRVCYGSTITAGTATYSPSMVPTTLTYPHDTPFQIKIFRNDTHAIVDLWENDGNISGFYRKNQ